jgi:hypothetical protein
LEFCEPVPIDVELADIPLLHLLKAGSHTDKVVVVGDSGVGNV